MAGWNIPAQRPVVLSEKEGSLHRTHY